jgi:hypothetical protein
MRHNKRYSKLFLYKRAVLHGGQVATMPLLAAAFVWPKLIFLSFNQIPFSNNFCKSTTTFLLFNEVAKGNYKCYHCPVQQQWEQFFLGIKKGTCYKSCKWYGT